MTRETVKSRQQVYFSESDIDYDDLTEICSQKTLQEDYSLADSVSNNVVIYDANHLKSFIVNELKERILKTELHQVLENGPGVFVVRNLYEGEVIDQSNTIFFNPAVFHAAGANTTNDFHRIGNLFQISSPFGKPIERIDYIKIINHIYPSLLEHLNKKNLSEKLIDNVLICATDGYAFPTNLDHDNNSDSKLQGMSMYELTKQSLLDSLSLEKFSLKLSELQHMRLAS